MDAHRASVYDLSLTIADFAGVEPTTLSLSLSLLYSSLSHSEADSRADRRACVCTRSL
jgi:hypothetical protein